MIPELWASIVGGGEKVASASGNSSQTGRRKSNRYGQGEERNEGKKALCLTRAIVAANNRWGGWRGKVIGEQKINQEKASWKKASLDKISSHRGMRKKTARGTGWRGDRVWEKDAEVIKKTRGMWGFSGNNDAESGPATIEVAAVEWTQGRTRGQEGPLSPRTVRENSDRRVGEEGKRYSQDPDRGKDSK